MWFQSEALILDCTYSVTAAWKIETYFCTARIIYVGHNWSVSKASHNHTLGKKHEDVKGLSASDRYLKCMPRTLAKVFPNLEGVNIQSSGLTKIKKEDLAQISNLKELNLYGNKIQALDGNLFEDHPGIQYICFRNNPLKHIGLNSFRGMKELKRIDLHKAGCVSEDLSGRTASKALIKKLLIKCRPTWHMMEQDLFAGKEFQKSVDARINKIWSGFKNK